MVFFIAFCSKIKLKKPIYALRLVSNGCLSKTGYVGQSNRLLQVRIQKYCQVLIVTNVVLLLQNAVLLCITKR